ncbi:MAG: EF-P lysine aminoacylase GenX [Dokdonella sp.]|nr:EF-P lysine aminoacylase GenX [Dokdonella sp.]
MFVKSIDGIVTIDENYYLVEPRDAGHDTVSGQLAALRLRARVYTCIRDFFTRRGVLEVETPILSRAGNSEPNIESFCTRFKGPGIAGPAERWLRTSPEYALKRLLAAGIGDCYELGRVFRNGEAGGRHNPEFTMLEWYRVGWDHRDLAEETVALVREAGMLVSKKYDLYSVSYKELFVSSLMLDPWCAPVDELRAALGATRIDPEGLERDDWLDLAFTHCIQPGFPRDRITVVHDWPASQCALARVRPGDPPVAERFELYLGPHELANGYHELTDAAEQGERFARDLERRRARGQVEPPLDEAMLAALRSGLPNCAGVALGIERLLMCLAGSDDIRDVLAFAFDEA